eukprot:jgi/Mesvir1/24075/Mv10797-RA.1
MGGGGHGGSCAHNHECDALGCAGDWSLWQNVNKDGVRCLNEAVPGSARSVFKSWSERLDFSTCLMSNDDDPELLLFVPFSSDVKIKGLSVVGGGGGSAPSKVRIFINREDLDLSSAGDTAPVQEIELAEDSQGQLEYPTRYAKFQGVGNVTLHFPSNVGGVDQTCIHYIGFKGESTQMRRDAVATVVYEAAPQPKDHKVPGGESGAFNLIQ